MRFTAAAPDQVPTHIQALQDVGWLGGYVRELVKDAGASVEAIGMRMGSYSNWEVFEDLAEETEVEKDVVGEVRTTDEGGRQMG